MAAATSNSNKRPGQRPQSVSGRGTHTPSSPEAVDPIWLLKAVSVVVAAALVCGYLTYCLLFYQGEWQFVLHPDRAKPAPAQIAGVPAETVRFGVDESGAPQLVGCWFPASATARYATDTILYLPSGDGSLADAQPTLAALHSLGVNLFAFDYRGYGQSAATHPDERRMTEDTRSAWQYLTVARHIPQGRIIALGEGVGASLAANLALSQPRMAAVILQWPRTDLLASVSGDPRTRLLPVRILFHDRFDLSDSVHALKTPKLFLLKDSISSDMARQGADPKVIVVIPQAQATVGAAYSESISRFLDQIELAD